MKNTLEGINSRTDDTEKCISGLKDENDANHLIRIAKIKQILKVRIVWGMSGITPLCTMTLIIKGSRVDKKEKVSKMYLTELWLKILKL